MLVFTYPGQGSQRPGMGSAWQAHPSWSLVDQAQAATGRDVEHLLLHSDADELTRTSNAQLATFVLSLVILDAVRNAGVPAPGLAAGHSLGEYTALVATGALSFADGCRVVVERGEAMQQAADERPGSMSAVLGLDAALVETACAQANGDAWVANDNAPGQVVIAGSPAALELAAVAAKALGAKRVVGLPVGGAFHSPYMASAETRLVIALHAAKFGDPAISVVANVDAEAHGAGSAQNWPGLCRRQLTSPVTWRASVERLVLLGGSTFVEIGPGAVLTGLAKRIAPDVSAQSVNEPAQLDSLVEAAA